MGNHTTSAELFIRQGPSLESWSEYDDKSGPGTDQVLSIHCEFWPNEAAEWIHRSRNFDWPKSFDISSIVKFGFHLVPVGHPYSDLKMIEWRISFSMAERALVWSFNHVQMQCYAIMKIILKEFIKVRCSPENQVLCSYFIKTFLFWKFETTELNFWRAENLRECIRVLASAFSRCIREGVIRHYFIPKFNLLSVKLTRAAQIELLQLLDIIIESDINFLKECRTLHTVWSEFLQIHQNRNNVIVNLKRRNVFNVDYCMHNSIIKLKAFESDEKKIISGILSVFCKTPLKSLTLRKCIFEYIRHLFINSCGSGNKGIYQLKKIVKNDTISFDISTCKLWCAILLYMRRYFLSTLDIVNQLLSNIPPYYICKAIETNQFESTHLYMDMFLNSDTTVTQRLRKAWDVPFVLFERYVRFAAFWDSD